jgi:phosphatidylglycerol:prolipoprotein diacylglycerol transferase
MLGYIPYPSWIHPEIIPGLAIPRWYGLMYLLAFLVAYLLFMRQLKEKEEKPNRDLVLDMFFWGVVGLLVGARAAFVLIYDTSGQFLTHPWQIFLPFTFAKGKLVFTGLQGMSYHGGLVGVIVALVIFMKVRKIDALEWSDMLVAGIPLGYTFGRLGNFLNGELYGRITRAAWGMVFPVSNPDQQLFPVSLAWVRDFASSIGLPLPASGTVNLPRYPSQLYEAFFEGLVLWLILWFIVRKRKPFKGFVVACYILGYGVFRFFIEYTREPDFGIGYPITLVHLDNPLSQFSAFNFTTGQILCFIMIAAAVVCFFVFRSRAAAQAPQAGEPHPSGRKLRKKLRKGM